MFVGHRAWRIFDWQAGLLGAVVHDFPWPEPVLKVPDVAERRLPTGGSGFYAFKTPPHAAAYLLDMVDQYRGTWGPGDHPIDYGVGPLGWALGEVGLYGTVTEYERGYRASHVLVRRLAVSPIWDQRMVDRIADRYQCPVDRWRERPRRGAPWWWERLRRRIQDG